MKYFYVLNIFIVLFSVSSYGKNPLTSSRLNRLSGDSKVNFDHKTIWDRRYNKRNYVYGKSPARFLAESFDYIPPESKILDIGMGEGRNAVFLAKKGHHVTGIDISSIAIKKAKLLAKEFDVRIQTILGDIKKYAFKPNSYDVIICFYFVDMDLNKKLLSWLRPGGILIYEAHTTGHYAKKNIKREEFSAYLKPQELLTMFKDTLVLKFEEPIHEKELRSGIILKKKGGI